MALLCSHRRHDSFVLRATRSARPCAPLAALPPTNLSRFRLVLTQEDPDATIVTPFLQLPQIEKITRIDFPQTRKGKLEDVAGGKEVLAESDKREIVVSYWEDLL